MSSYQKFIRDNDATSGALLGGFNEDDKYVVSSSVISELLKIKKLITKYTLEYIVCHAEISDYKINFLIKYVDDNLDNKRYASLYLIENYESMGKKIELSTFVASFSHINDVAYFDALKTAFNLYTIEDLGEGKSIKDENEVLASILNGSKKTSQIMILSMGNENRKYINSVLKVLKNTSQFDVLYKIFKEQISLIKIDKNTAKYFNEVKKVLDALVIKHYSEFSESTRIYLDQINKDYMQKYKMMKEKSTSQDVPVAESKKKGGKGKDKGKSKGKSSSYKPFDFGLGKYSFDYKFDEGSPQSQEKTKDIGPSHPHIQSSEQKMRPAFDKEFLQDTKVSLTKESSELNTDTMENISSKSQTRSMQKEVAEMADDKIDEKGSQKIHIEKSIHVEESFELSF